MKTSKEEVDRQIAQQEFAKFLQLIGRGDFLAEIGTELKSVNEKLSTLASQNGKAKGEITIKLAIKHEANGVVEVHPDLKVKLPSVVRGKSVFWATEGGGLAANDPRQQSLPLREVPAPAAAPKDIAANDKPAKSL